MKFYSCIFFLLLVKITVAQKQDTVKCDPNILVPTVFSSNDEINLRTYLPVVFADSLPEIFKFEIYDHLGNLIFTTVNPEQGWNGKKQNKYNAVPDGTYYWTIAYKMQNEIQTHSCTGYVQCIGLSQLPPPQVVDTTDCSVYIPNVCLPNGETIDYFIPSFTCPLFNYEMWIYDRWGNEVFYTGDINKGWYGTIKSGQKAEIGTYVYKIKYSYSENEKMRTAVGHVSLIW